MPSSGLTDADVQRTICVLGHAWSEGTAETYGSGLLRYHVWCDRKGVSEADRAPASRELVLAFIAANAGAVSGGYVGASVSAIHAWHQLHCLRTDWVAGELFMPICQLRAFPLTDEQEISIMH